MIGVYKITNPKGRIYIGSSIEIKKRLSRYESGSCKAQPRIYNSIKKYGFSKHTFEVLEECELDVLLEREFYHGDKYNVLGSKGMNCKLPNIGEGYTVTSKAFKEKARKRMEKLLNCDIKEIRILLRENKLTHYEISLMFNVNRKTISNIQSGRTYSGIHSEIDVSNRKQVGLKLFKKDIMKIKKLIKKGMSQGNIAKLYNIDQSTISVAINK